MKPKHTMLELSGQMIICNYCHKEPANLKNPKNRKYTYICDNCMTYEMPDKENENKDWIPFCPVCRRDGF